MAQSPFRGEGHCDVPLAPGRLFHFVADGYFENAPEWDAGTIEFAKTSEGPVGRGTTGRHVRMASSGFREEQTLEVIEYERDRRFTVQATSSAGGLLRTAFVLEPKGDGTRLTVRLEMDWVGGNSMLRSLMREDVRRAPAVIAGRIAAAVEEPSANI